MVIVVTYFRCRVLPGEKDLQLGVTDSYLPRTRDSNMSKAGRRGHRGKAFLKVSFLLTISGKIRNQSFIVLVCKVIVINISIFIILILIMPAIETTTQRYPCYFYLSLICHGPYFPCHLPHHSTKESFIIKCYFSFENYCQLMYYLACRMLGWHARLMICRNIKSQKNNL